MFGFFIVLFFDTVALVGLMVALSGDGIGIGQSAVISGIFALVTTIFGLVLAAVLGLLGFLIAAVVAAGILGLVISAMFGMEIKRAFGDAGAFAAVHVIVSIAVAFLLAPARPQPHELNEIQLDVSSRPVAVASEIV